MYSQLVGPHERELTPLKVKFNVITLIFRGTEHYVQEVNAHFESCPPMFHFPNNFVDCDDE
jgi:hypothetical protein